MHACQDTGIDASRGELSEDALLFYSAVLQDTQKAIWSRDAGTALTPPKYCLHGLP